MYSRHPTHPNSAARFAGMSFHNLFCARGRGRALTPAGTNLPPSSPLSHQDVSLLPFHAVVLIAMLSSSCHCHAVLLIATSLHLPLHVSDGDCKAQCPLCHQQRQHSSSDLRALSTPHPRYPLTQQRCPSHGEVEKEERNLLPGGHVQGRVNAKQESALPVQLSCGAWPWMPGRSLGWRKSCNVPPPSPG